MALLEKIRVKFGLAASIIIAIGLLSFIIDPGQLETAFQSMSSKNDVGEIDGKTISYVDFQDNVADFTTINEILTGSSTSSAQQQANIREQAWNSLISKYLFNKNAQAAGLYVGDDEMVELTSGTEVSPMIAQNPMFADENGYFSKEALLNFLSSKNSDQSGRSDLYWNFLQESILNQQYIYKYSSLFSQSAFTNKVQLKREIAENNNTADVEFVMVPFGYERDSSVVVSDSEIKKYYNNHKKFFKQPASRDIEYVVFEVKPSAEDIQKANDDIAELHEEFAATENVKNFLLRNSDRAYDEYFYKAGELKTINPAVDQFVWNSSENVSGIINSGNDFYVARVMDTKQLADSVYVNHILLQGADAQHLADSLVNVVNKDNFSANALLYSADKGSAADGRKGAIGWMTQTYMIPGFESVIEAKVNVPYTIKTQYGVHVVLVTDKSKELITKKKVAILKKTAIASRKTIDKKYAEANAFATAAAGGYKNYQAASDSLVSHPVNNLLEGSEKLGGIDNTKEVTRWVYSNKAGKVSPIITVDNNYFFVATVKAIHKEGYATLSEVSSSIRQNLYYEKLGEKKAAEIAEKIQGKADLQSIAEALNTTVSTSNAVAFSSMNNQGLDPKFIGAVSAAPENQVCGPVAGNIGVYVFTVKAKETGSFYTEDDAKQRDARLNAYAANMLIRVMEDDADVKDNRARFY